jgi:hypothetical protein
MVKWIRDIAWHIFDLIFADTDSSFQLIKMIG